MVTVAGSGTANITIANSGVSVQVPVIVPELVRVLPSTESIYVSQTQQFYAKVALPPDTDRSVVWSISPPVGSIDNSGLYTAPSSSASWQEITVTATSVAYPTKTASAKIWVFPPVSVVIEIHHQHEPRRRAL